MNGKIDFTIGAVKATEGIGHFFKPKIQFVHFENGKASQALDMIDHFLFEIRTAKKIIEDSIVEIKSYSTKRAKKDLQELYILEDAIEHLVEIAKSLKPESKKEEILLKEFVAFGDTFINMIGLVEVMSLPLSRRKRIMSKDKIASRGSRILKSEDLLD